MRVLVFSIVLCACAAMVAAQQPATSPGGKEPTSQALGIFRVTSDPTTALSTGDLIARLVMSPSIYGEAIANAAGKTPEEPLREVAQITALASDFYNHGQKLPDAPQTAPGVGLVWVNVTSFDKRIDAKKLLEKVATSLENHLRDLDTKHVTEYTVAQARERMLILGIKFNKERQVLMQLASLHKVEIDPALEAQKRLRLETELQSLNVQRQGLKARREVIEHVIGELDKKTTQSPAQDAARKALTARVDAQKAVLAKIRTAHTSGTAMDSDVEDARAQLLQAEAELVKFATEQAQEAGGGRIMQLRMRLDDTAIEIAEIETRLTALEEYFKGAQQNSGQVVMKRIEVELLENEYRAQAAEVSALETERRRYVPPQVTLIPL